MSDFCKAVHSRRVRLVSPLAGLMRVSSLCLTLASHDITTCHIMLNEQADHR